MNRYFIIWALCMIVMPVMASGGNENQHIRRGNQQYTESNFADAEIAYRRSIEMNSQNATALYNLGNALYKQERYEEAAELFDALAQTAPSGFDRASAFHNLGNAHLGNNNIQGSIDAYKQALRLNPADDETRYNLAYALKKLEENPSEDQQQGDDKQDDNQEQNDGDDQQNQDQQNQDQQDQDQQQGDDQNQQDQESGDDEQQQQSEQPEQQDDREEQAQPRPDQISQQDAERILNALNQKEQQIQEQLNSQNTQTKPSKVEKEW